MKRDMDLIRKILLKLESSDRDYIDSIDGYNDRLVSHHIRMLDEAGLIEGTDVQGETVLNWRARWIKWQGYEFLEASRDEGRWKKAKSIVLKKGGGLSFAVLQALLVRLMNDAVMPDSQP